MRRQIAIGALLFVTASGEFSLAADPRYPDWPCTQAKVPEISLAAVWAGPPLDDVKNKWKDDARVSALVPKLAARRTSLEDAQKAITEFVAGSAADKATAGKLLFTGLFDTLNAQRSSVLPQDYEHDYQRPVAGAGGVVDESVELGGGEEEKEERPARGRRARQPREGGRNEVDTTAATE